MIELEESPGVYRLSAGRLQIAFFRSGDRWSHALALRDQTGWQSLLSSTEGAPDVALPPSPAFQDLRHERFDGNVHEFQLFGQAGSGVYSAAIRVDGTVPTITFDIAARSLREGAELCLESAYEISDRIQVSADSAAGGLAIPGESGGVVLVPVPPAVAESRPEARKTNHSASLAVGCLAEVGADRAKSPRNARWKYEIRLAPGP